MCLPVLTVTLLRLVMFLPKAANALPPNLLQPHVFIERMRMRYRLQFWDALTLSDNPDLASLSTQNICLLRIADIVGLKEQSIPWLMESQVKLDGAVGEGADVQGHLIVLKTFDLAFFRLVRRLAASNWQEVS